MAASSAMREASSRRRAPSVATMSEPAAGADFFVNGSPATVSVDPDGVRWTFLDSAAAAAAAAGPLPASLLPLSYCLPLLAPLGATPNSVPFSEMVAAQRLDRSVAGAEGPWGAPATATAAAAPGRRLHGLAVFTIRRAAGRPCEWLPWAVTVESTDEEAIEAMLGALGSGVAAASAPRPRRLLVLLNPNAGSGAARAQYSTVVAPVLARAGVAATVIETQGPGHAADVVRDTFLKPHSSPTESRESSPQSLILSTVSNLLDSVVSESQATYDGVVAVGGDGLFHEVLNGILEARSRAPVALRPALASLRLAHVPCGSTDAVASSLNGCRSVFAAAAHVALGDSTPLDALRVAIGGIMKHACCIAAYGFMGDVVRESEQLRWLGPLRYDVVGAAKLLGNRSYRCRVSYLPPPAEPEDLSAGDGGEGSIGERSAAGDTVCLAQCPVCRAASSSRSQLDLAALGAEVGPSPSSITAGGGPEWSASTVPGKGVWVTVEDEWMSIMLIVQPCRSDKTPAGMARHGHLANGRFTLALVRRCSPLEYLRFLHTMASVGLTPGLLPGVEVVEAVVARVEAAGGPTSHWNVDGEIVEGVDMEAHAHLGAVQCFARGVEG